MQSPGEPSRFVGPQQPQRLRRHSSCCMHYRVVCTATGQSLLCRLCLLSPPVVWVRRRWYLCCEVGAACMLLLGRPQRQCMCSRGCVAQFPRPRSGAEAAKGREDGAGMSGHACGPGGRCCRLAHGMLNLPVPSSLPVSLSARVRTAEIECHPSRRGSRSSQQQNKEGRVVQACREVCDGVPPGACTAAAFHFVAHA